ncbi:hypothetical protein XENORESO_020029 [Xenotaenia resolanae]|uniref:Uncharacterized protein n=1 Tax=Xenotaenia resolanae TaxID=208358 RepID=A0ABV0WDR0_9TELE
MDLILSVHHETQRFFIPGPFLQATLHRTLGSGSCILDLVVLDRIYVLVIGEVLNPDSDLHLSALKPRRQSHDASTHHLLHPIIIWVGLIPDPEGPSTFFPSGKPGLRR